MVAALAFVALASPAVAGGGAQGLDYVALGDSVAAGRGLGDTGGLCRRSPRAYPRLVLRELRQRVAGAVRFASVACSGATAGVADAPGLRSLRRQVTAALERLSGGRALATVTVGINDFEWSDIPRTYLRLREPQAVFDVWLAARASDVERALRTQLARLLSRRGVRVVATGYFNPVNRESVLFAGPVPCLSAAACLARTDAIVDAVNASIRAAVRGLGHRARVKVVSLRAGFRGHESPSPRCGNAPPAVASTWIQHPDDQASNSFPLADFPELVPLLGSGWRGDCFHPNDAGAAFIAGEVARAARGLGR